MNTLLLYRQQPKRSSSCLLLFRRRPGNTGSRRRRRDDSCVLFQQLQQRQHYQYQQSKFLMSSTSSSPVVKKDSSLSSPLSSSSSVVRRRSGSAVVKRDNSNNTTNGLQEGHQPPLAIRSALVASTTAICTPAFPVVGFVNFAVRCIPDVNVRKLVFQTASVGTCMTIIYQVAKEDLLPLAFSYSKLFAPFAVVNGALAGSVYTVLDVVLGTAMIARNPLWSAGMGAFVGYVGPSTGLYDSAFEWLYDIDEPLGMFTFLVANPFVLPISTTTGAFVGFVLHPLLYYPIKGIPPYHWTKFSLPLLLGSFAIMANLYIYKEDYPLSPQTYALTTKEKQQAYLVSRFHAKTLKAVDWDQQSKKCYDFREGKLIRDSIRNKQKQGIAVFDSEKQAWIYDMVMRPTAIEIDWNMKHCIPNMPKELDIIRSQSGTSLLSGDGIVGFLVGRHYENNNNHHDQDGNGNDRIGIVRDNLKEIAKEFLLSSTHNDNNNNNNNNSTAEEEKNRDIEERAGKIVQNIEMASFGVALLMIQNKNSHKNSHTKETKMRLLETSIRQLVPGILLFRADEKDDSLKGCSIESQLRDLNWTVGKHIKEQEEETLQQQWSDSMRKNQQETKEKEDWERKQKRRRMITTAAMRLSIAMIIGFLFGSSSSTS